MTGFLIQARQGRIVWVLFGAGLVAMIGTRSILGVLAFLLTVVSAHAFQETAYSPSASASAASATPAEESAIGLADDDAGSGSGTIASGVPNLNFGLELLYGGRSTPSALPAEDDVGLKGRLRHTF